MSASPVSFSFPDARTRLLGTKDEYLAFTTAWKALTRTRASVPAGFYAAHAILLGRDLYKTFSPSRRPHDEGQPYRALLQAFEHLARLNRSSKHFKVEFPGLSEEHAKALRSGVLLSAMAVDSADLSNHSSSGRLAIVTGTGRFPQSTVPATAQAVEA